MNFSHAIQFLIKSLTDGEKLYLARLLNREGLYIDWACSNGVCSECKTTSCVHNCHIKREDV